MNAEPKEFIGHKFTMEGVTSCGGVTDKGLFCASTLTACYLPLLITTRLKEKLTSE
jgi:hypothetical protein